jgi:hypothetical protein
MSKEDELLNKIESYRIRLAPLQRAAEELNELISNTTRELNNLLVEGPLRRRTKLFYDQVKNNPFLNMYPTEKTASGFWLEDYHPVYGTRKQIINREEYEYLKGLGVRCE